MHIVKEGSKNSCQGEDADANAGKLSSLSKLPGEEHQHNAHSQHDADSHLLFYLHLKPPEHRHWKCDNDEVEDQIQDCREKLESSQISAMATWGRLVEAVGNRRAYEKRRQQNRKQSRHVDRYKGPADHFEPPDHEDTDVKQEH